MNPPADDARKSTGFVPESFDPPRPPAGDRFRFEPLGPDHNARDYEAWTSSVDFIRALPGFEESRWPHPMTPAENLSDLEKHAADFRDRTGFTYSILDGDDVIGCVYIYPSSEPGHDARITSWVTAGRAEMDAPVRETIRSWIRNAWPFGNPSIP